MPKNKKEMLLVSPKEIGSIVVHQVVSPNGKIWVAFSALPITISASFPVGNQLVERGVRGCREVSD
jgi:hypothetical protein